jgi:hypothetical protein
MARTPRQLAIWHSEAAPFAAIAEVREQTLAAQSTIGSS